MDAADNPCVLRRNFQTDYIRKITLDFAVDLTRSVVTYNSPSISKWKWMAPCLETPTAYKLGSLMVPVFCFGILAKICLEFMMFKQSKKKRN